MVDKLFRYGKSGDQIIKGDWTGNGRDGIAIFRPSTGYCYFDNNLDGKIDTSFRFGKSGDQILAGDWDGDGVDGITIFRPSTGYWYLNYSSTSTVDQTFPVRNNRGYPRCRDLELMNSLIVFFLISQFSIS